MRAVKASAKNIDLPGEESQIIGDYRLAYRSRQASLIGRREVLSGKAKFGIFGDGKELANIAIGHVFRKGDWRSGYYRDQTWMDMLGVMSLQQMFAQLYAHADLLAEPNTGGRGMNAHFASRYVRADGTWIDQTSAYNSAADVSPTGTQMPRAVGLAYASVLYRQLDALKAFPQFSRDGNEITFATIGNASTAEGLFWESLNAIGVLQAPAIITVFDDGYGISVPNQFQMVKENIHDILEGFQARRLHGAGLLARIRSDAGAGLGLLQPDRDVSACRTGCPRAAHPGPGARHGTDAAAGALHLWES